MLITSPVVALDSFQTCDHLWVLIYWYSLIFINVCYRSLSILHFSVISSHFYKYLRLHSDLVKYWHELWHSSTRLRLDSGLYISAFGWRLEGPLEASPTSLNNITPHQRASCPLNNSRTTRMTWRRCWRVSTLASTHGCLASLAKNGSRLSENANGKLTKPKRSPRRWGKKP